MCFVVNIFETITNKVLFKKKPEFLFLKCDLRQGGAEKRKKRGAVMTLRSLNANTGDSTWAFQMMALNGKYISS